VPAATATIAVLDDEPQMRKALRRLLATHGFQVEEYETGGDFLQAFPTHPADCIILDLQMPEVNGFDVLELLDPRHLTPPIVVLTAHGEPGTAERVLGLGAANFLTKPVGEGRLLGAIRTAISHTPTPHP
jgi:two-component system, LuxR family, response regulator FixJ